MMVTNNEYNVLVENVIKYFSSKKFNGMYMDIIEDIKELDEASISCNKREKSFSAVMYQVKFLKSQYVEELKDTIQTYNEIIFKDFSFKHILKFGGVLLWQLKSDFAVWALKRLLSTV